jgi:hypothetical protein
MNILSYLLGFSLVLLSAVQTADLFIRSDRALQKIEIEFVDYTKLLLKTPKNKQKGSLTLAAALITALLSLTLLFFVTKMKIEYKEALYRKESYLCFHYLNVKTQKYIDEMAYFNVALTAAYLALHSAVATAEAMEAFKALILSRNIRHFVYIKSLIQNSNCKKLEGQNFLKNTPFKIQPNFALITKSDETSIVRQKEWSITYFKRPSGIRLKKSFCLKSHFSISSAYLPQTLVDSTEIPIVVLSSSNCFSGALSSLSF